MSSPARDLRTHRILTACAVLHALLITLWLVLSWPMFPWNGKWESGPKEPNLWVAFATLWLFWPIILLFHPGRSFARVIIPMAASILILFPSFREYDSLAPRTFGLPEDIGFLSPRGIWDYYAGYRAGRADAEKDLRSGHLAHEEIGMPMPEEYYQVLRRHEIETRRFGDIVSTKTIAHAKGYNEIAEPAITQKFGSDVISAAYDEAMKHWNEAQAKRNP
jgi:hypothetical protein